MDDPLVTRLAAVERAQRRLVWLLAFQVIALGVLGAALVANCASARGQQDAAASLRVEELVVVDPAGVTRARIGGDLPDAVIQGKRVPRGEAAAGILLYDSTGQERGGYVTWEPSGNVGLTLDTRRMQTALFVAGPESGSALMIRHGGESSIELRSDEQGSRITAVEEGRIAFQEPPVEVVGEEACDAYREARSRLSEEEVLDACRRRFPDEACLECLGGEE